MCLFDTGFIRNTLGTLCKGALAALYVLGALDALGDTLFVLGDTLGGLNTLGCCMKAFV